MTTDRTVTIITDGKIVATAELQLLTVDEAPCIFCGGHGFMCYEFIGTHAGRLFTCGSCHDRLLGADQIRMPWNPDITRVRVYMEGVVIGDLQAEKVPEIVP